MSTCFCFILQCLHSWVNKFHLQLYRQNNTYMWNVWCCRWLPTAPPLLQRRHFLTFFFHLKIVIQDIPFHTTNNHRLIAGRFQIHLLNDHFEKHQVKHTWILSIKVTWSITYIILSKKWIIGEKGNLIRAMT